MQPPTRKWPAGSLKFSGGGPVKFIDVGGRCFICTRKDITGAGRTQVISDAAAALGISNVHDGCFDGHASRLPAGPIPGTGIIPDQTPLPPPPLTVHGSASASRPDPEASPIASASPCSDIATTEQDEAETQAGMLSAGSDDDMPATAPAAGPIPGTGKIPDQTPLPPPPLTVHGSASASRPDPEASPIASASPCSDIATTEQDEAETQAGMLSAGSDDDMPATAPAKSSFDGWKPTMPFADSGSSNVGTTSNVIEVVESAVEVMDSDPAQQ